MKLIISLLIAFLYLENAFSEANTEFFKSKAGDHYLVSHNEEGKWTLDHYLIKKGELQEKIFSRYFSDEASLKEYKNQNFSQFLKLKSGFKKDNYVFTEISNQIWEVKNTWNEDWEKKFSKWLEQNFDKDFFVKYNISTDCADVVFSLRWIFARNNALPAANTLAGSGILFSQDSFKKQWQNLKRDNLWHQDKVFLAALNYLLQNAYTGTLYKDTYPIELNKDSFSVGTIYLIQGHAMVVSKIDYEGKESAPIWILSSTVPAMVRTLAEELFVTSQMVDASVGGLVRMRWPVKSQKAWKLTPKKSMPLYSLEQYSPDFSTSSGGQFTLALLNKLSITFKPKKVVEELATSLVNTLTQRKEIVELGYNSCLNQDCSPGTNGYEEFSSPSRDKRLNQSFLSSNKIVMDLSEIENSLSSYWNHLKEETLFFDGSSEKDLSYYEKIFNNSLASYDPRDSIAQRWASTFPDILSMIKKRTKIYRAQRLKIVNRAKNCIDAMICNRGTTNWQELNTYKFDHKIYTETYKAFLYATEIFKVDFKDYLKDMNLEDMPFWISEPNVASNIRWGDAKVTSSSQHLPKGKRYIQTSRDEFVIDEKIYSISKQRFNSSWDGFVAVGYNSDRNILVGVKNQELWFKENNNLNKVNINTQARDVVWINNDYVLVSDCLFDLYNKTSNIKSCSFEILQYRNSSFSLIRSLRNISLLNTSFENTRNPFIDKDFGALIFKSSGNLEAISFVGNLYYENTILSNATYLQSYLIGNALVYGLEDKNYSVINLNNFKQCDTEITVNNNYINIENNTFLDIADEQTNRSDVYTIIGDCELNLILSNKEHPYFDHIGNTHFIQFDNIKMGVYRNHKLDVFTNLPNFYPTAQDEYQIGWSFYQDAKLSKYYSQNIDDGSITNYNPNYFPSPCSGLICDSRSKETKRFNYIKNSASVYEEFLLVKDGEDYITSSFNNFDYNDSFSLSMNLEPSYIYFKYGTIIQKQDRFKIYINN